MTPQFFNITPYFSNAEKKASDIILQCGFSFFENFNEIILCVGDSYTHGDGIGDLLFAPDSLFFTCNEFQNSKLGLNYSKKLEIVKKRISWLESNINNRSKYYSFCRENSWPNKLINLRPDKCILNLSKGGGSIHRSIRIGIDWVLNLKNFLPNMNIKFILGDTIFTRTELLDKNLVSYNFIPLLADLHHDKPNHPISLMAKIHTYHYDDKILLQMYFNALINFCIFLKHHNVPLLMTHWLINSIDGIPIIDSEMFSPYKSILGPILENSLNMLSFAKTEPSDKVMMPDGHYTPLVHEKFASELAKII